MKSIKVESSPHRGTRSFTTTVQDDWIVVVREWEMVTPAVARAVTEVLLPVGEYRQVTAAHGGDEPTAQHAIVADARRHMERRIMTRLVRWISTRQGETGRVQHLE